MLVDRYGRTIETLRVSITDRCNFRCVYCSIGEKTTFLPKERIVSFEEIEKIVKIMVDLGIKRVKITGGEPLVRRDIQSLIKKISTMENIVDLSLTTNGSLLTEDMVNKLVNSGLTRINISLDSLNPETFSRITGGGNLDNVLQGINYSLKAGFKAVKINTVLIKGINDGEIFELFNFAKINNLTLRFIEEMPFSKNLLSGVSNNTVYNILKRYLDTEHNVTGYYYPGPAVTYRIKGSAGKIGFISPFSRPFCASCNRVRLTTTGKLLPCISRNEGLELLPLIRGNVNENIIKAKIRNIIYNKSFMHNGFKEDILMNQLGG